MSHLLTVLRQIFEYFHIPTERLIQLWESYTNSRSIVRMIGTHLPSNPFSRLDFQFIPVLEFKRYGCTRSVVRMIGAFLPLDPCPRPRFQHVLGQALESPVVPSLADVAWVANDGRESNATFRIGTSTTKTEEQMLCAKPASTRVLPSFPEGSLHAGVHAPQNEEAIQKIKALEEELTQLRAQIAVIVAIQEQRNSSAPGSLFASPTGVLPGSGLTSTPLSASAHHLATPPPPPPPPLPPVNPDFSNSAVSLIKQRRAASSSRPNTNEAMKRNTESKPSMMDVLKDMKKIRLRSVERSPGGTPVMKKGKKRNSMSDPAELIAHALKQKFAHQKENDSFDKENRSFEGSPFSSPETPMFGRHLLKPCGKRPPLTEPGQATNVPTVKVRAHI